MEINSIYLSWKKLKNRVTQLSLVLLFLFYFTPVSICQNVAINETGVAPDASAMLDISSQTKGFLLPRMTALERTTIPFPQTGLLVFDLDLESLFIFDGGAWVEFASTRKGLRDSDFDTRVVVEQGDDDDIIRLMPGGEAKVEIHDDGIVYHSAVDNNIFIGSGGKEKGYKNTIIGHDAGLTMNDLGNDNVAIGNLALKDLSDPLGDRNTVIGFSAGQSLNTGFQNVFVGYKAYNANEGNGNTSIGNSSGIFTDEGGDDNVFLGNSAFKATSGSNNISIGPNSGELNNASGNGNIFVGENAGFSLQSSLLNNIVIGRNSGFFTQGGNENIVLGTGSGDFTNGALSNNNIFIGTDAGESNSIGTFSKNIVIGHDAGQDIKGNGNIFIGQNSGSTTTSCDDCILIGKNVGVDSVLSDVLFIDNNTLANNDPPLIYGDFTDEHLSFNGNVGINLSDYSPDCSLHVKQNANNSVEGGFKLQSFGGPYWRFYTFGNGELHLYSESGDNSPACGGIGPVVTLDKCSGEWNSTSDRRRKKNFIPLESVLPSIINLDILKYHFLPEKDSDQKHIGLIAQDVYKYFPELIKYNIEADLYTMNYNGFGPIAIKAVQELKAENDQLKQALNNQQTSIETQQTEINILRKEMMSIKAQLDLH